MKAELWISRRVHRRGNNCDNYVYALKCREHLFDLRTKLVTYIDSAFDRLQKILIHEIDTRDIQQGDEEACVTFVTETCASLHRYKNSIPGSKNSVYLNLITQSFDF